MPAAKYIHQLTERIETALKAARVNEESVQRRNKNYYDRQCSERHLEVGDLALILMPTDSNKLTATWQGPYRVVTVGENNNYVLDVKGRQALLHINTLRKYIQGDDNDRTVTVNMIITGDDDLRAEAAGETSETTSRQKGGQRYAMGEQLTANQRETINGLVHSYPDVFKETALPSRKATNDNEYLIIIPHSRQNEVIRFSQGNQTQQTVWNRAPTQVWGG